ncbi:hypothetical protein N7510_007463 [Penicillium lagena]|uniref:uncharacterized protein n=1 Tax=Penicillium lagena TaxID=94218 RepID=UPI0025402699|nr:uncharacterized protein N7510_007463 [Penicillium lagena]KAJ5610744.1 hypothetical protein N7510_007463 [Penicillium lagena]
MSVPEPTSRRNGATTTILTQGNVSQIPRSSYSAVERFMRTPTAEGPYFAGARMQERSTHLTVLSSHLNAVDDIVKAKS